MSLTGKKILLVGANTEVGETIAKQLVSLNANVVLIDQDENKLKSLTDSIGGSNHAFHKIDFSNIKEIEKHIRVVVECFGAFNGFVFCNTLGGVRPLSLTKYENLLNMMNQNSFLFIEIVRCLSKKNYFENGGSIVALSSISSIRGFKSKLAYSVSKAALDASVKSLAAELAERKIRVNSILKAGLTIDKNIDYIKDISELNNNETMKQQVLGEIEPIEIANLTAFLLSDAVRTITGTNIIHDAGYNL